MPRFTLSTPIDEFYGSGLTTLPADNSAETVQRIINVPPGARELLIIGSETFRMALCPKVKEAYLVTSTSLTPVTGQALRDLLDPREAGVLGIPLSTTTFLVLGLNKRTAGVWFDVGTVNAVASTPVVDFAGGQGVWTALTVATDGTTSGGATLAVDGNMVWTTPTVAAWPGLRLRDMGGVFAQAPAGLPLHWLRVSASAGLTAGTSLSSLSILHADAAIDAAAGHSGYFAATTEYSIPITDEVGGIELRTRDASAGTFQASWIIR